MFALLLYCLTFLKKKRYADFKNTKFPDTRQLFI